MAWWLHLGLVIFLGQHSQHFAVHATVGELLAIDAGQCADQPGEQGGSHRQHG